MKKILVVASDLEIGGAERALLGLLEAIDRQKYQVDLFLLRHRGAFLKFFPEGVHLLPENPKYADLGIPMPEVLKKGHLDMVCGRIWGKYQAKRFIKEHGLKKENSVQIHYSFRYTLPFLPMISEKWYDLALGFTTPYYIVDQRVHAKSKAVWVHTDYEALDGDRLEENSVWSAYPHIVSVSEAVTQSFLSVYPKLKDRMFLMENIVSENMIRRQAKMMDVSGEMPKEEGVFRLLSIGRFTGAKNFDQIPLICQYLQKSGCNIRWYLIGFGDEEAKIRQNIRRYRMENRVILLGKKENPYPYIKACDFYIQPSRYEGKAVAVREAQILHKPVVITRFATAEAQVRDGVDGVIVTLDAKECAGGIAELIRDKKKQRELIQNCQRTVYSNAEEAKKLDELLEGSENGEGCKNQCCGTGIQCGT